MSLKPLITVFGATGAQGGGLVRALLGAGDRPFRVRAVTRRPGSCAARSLAALGAELCAADLDAPDSLARALQGAHGVFGVTSQREHRCAERELRQADHLAEAARRAGVQHVVWSTLDDTRRFVEPDEGETPRPGGRWNVPSWDAKGQADEGFIRRGLPLTRLRGALHWDLLLHPALQPRRAADGRLELVLPIGRARLPGIAAADIGACAAALFRQGEAAIGRRIGIAAEHLDVAQLAHALSRVLGEPVRHVAPDPADPAGLARPGVADADADAAERARLWRFLQAFGDELCAARDVEATRALHPGLLRFEDFLARHRSALAIAPTPRAAFSSA